MYDGGADVVYARGRRLGPGHVPGRQGDRQDARDVWGIGVDSDQYLTVGADLAAVRPDLDAEACRRRRVQHDRRLPRGQGQGGHRPVFDLKVNGVAYATTGGNLDDITSKLDDLKQQIIDGKITVPTAP